jgi:hypothetical protein
VLSPSWLPITVIDNIFQSKAQFPGASSLANRSIKLSHQFILKPVEGTDSRFVNVL